MKSTDIQRIRHLISGRLPPRSPSAEVRPRPSGSRHLPCPLAEVEGRTSPGSSASAWPENNCPPDSADGLRRYVLRALHIMRQDRGGRLHLVLSPRIASHAVRPRRLCILRSTRPLPSATVATHWPHREAAICITSMIGLTSMSRVVRG